MKKGIIIACLALFSLVSCSNNAKTEEKQPVKVVNTSKITTEATTEPITTAEITTEAEIPAATDPEAINDILYDDDNVTIYYTGYDNKKTVQRIYFTIENKTDGNLRAIASDFMINDVLIDQNYSAEATAKETISNNMTILNDKLQDKNISRVNSVDFKMQIKVTDASNGDCIDSYDTETLTIKR